MAMKWADEMSNYDPLPELESFFILAAIEVGDPDAPRWLETHAVAFHALYRKYHAGTRQPVDSATALIQYLVWYDRDSRKVKTHS